MNENKRLVAICMANFIWTLGSFVNIVFIFFIPAMFDTTDFQTGVIMSLISVAIFVGTLIYPKLASKYAPIKLYGCAVAIGAFSYIIASFFYDDFIIMLLAVLSAYITFSLTRGLNKKIVALAISPGNRRKAYSYSFALTNLGMVFSGVFAPYIFNLDVNNMRYIFLVNCVSSSVSYLILRLGVAEVTSEVIKSEPKSINKFKLNKQLLIATSLMYFGFFQISFLIPQTIEHFYSLHIYSLALVINTVVCVIASSLSAKILNYLQINEYKALIIGTCLIITSFILYNIIYIPALVLATILFAIGEVLIITNLDSYLLRIYNHSQYDRVLVAVRMLAQINRALGPIIASLLIMYASYTAAFGFVIIAMSIGLIPLLKFNKSAFN